MNLLTIENKSAKLKLNDIVMQPVMDDIIRQIGKVFGANAAETGEYTGELTNCFENAADTLDIEIHSPGGSVLDGYVLYHELLSLRKRGVYVTANINSLAASMASVIAMAADKITMVKGGRMMIHDVSQGVRGNAEDLAKAAKLCDDMSNEIALIYSNRTGIDKAKTRTMMKVETWMNADEAMQMRFIDEVIDNSISNNIIDHNANNVHLQTNKEMSLLSKLLAPSNEEIVAELESVKLDLGNTEAKFEETKGQLATAEAALQEAATEIQNLRNATVDFTAKLEAFNSEKELLTNALSAAEAKITPEAIQALVTAQIAGSGHPPLAIDNGLEPNKQENTLTRAEFNAISPAKRLAFVKKGGKIS